MKISISAKMFGAAITRKGKRWQATVETTDGEWTPWCDGAAPAAALAAAMDRLKEDDEAPAVRDTETQDFDFG